MLQLDLVRGKETVHGIAHACYNEALSCYSWTW